MTPPERDDERELKVRNRLQVVEGDAAAAADLFSRILNAVRKTKARLEREQNERDQAGEKSDHA
jgi:hypothetical protein